MLGGIVVNNGIMIIDRVQSLKTERPEAGIEDVLAWAGLQRIRPIFMTTTTTVIGLLPMALDRSESAVLWSPLAVTVIGGLIGSTVLTLYVVPCLYASLESLTRRILLHRRFPDFFRGAPSTSSKV
jgi:HAE1 family hydrophobic/amphiphilic exporter-1